MYLLDTDTISHLHLGHPKVTERLGKLADPDVGITVITKIEMLRGRFDYVLKAATGDDLLRAERLLKRTEELLEPIPIIPFDETAAERFDQLRVVSTYRKIGRADLLIASIALAHRATLVTRNVKHFRQFPGLHVENWVD
jgi:tRNA(fMet)-specific endonuclease VapC